MLTNTALAPDRCAPLDAPEPLHEADDLDCAHRYGAPALDLETVLREDTSVPHFADAVLA